MTRKNIIDSNNSNNNACAGDCKRLATKEKLQSIMEAASALTTLGENDTEVVKSESKTSTCNGKDGTDSSTDDHSESNHQEIGTSTSSSSSKRFIPEFKKPDAAPTFPEKVRIL
jgi:Flp pilus assembly protein TadG